MKITVRVFLSLFLLCSVYMNADGQMLKRCGVSDPAHLQKGEISNELIFENKAAIQKHKLNLSLKNELSTRELITIPVVVHIVWNQNEQNISDEQIFSQIEVLNQDFRATNTEISDIPSAFQNAIADLEIEFCLAQRDPDGNSTSGITRTFTQAPSILGSKNIHFEDQGGVNAWDTEHYLNIWVANGGSFAGFGSFPGVDPPEEDGVEINYKHFGNIGLDPPYHLGRTTTHEIGHYLNLLHVFGNDCSHDDLIDDTPTSDKSYLGQCPAHPSTSCGTHDMFMNYLNWTDDACMGMFTEGQKQRVLETLNGPRAGLLDSQGCQPVSSINEFSIHNPIISPNPSFDFLNIEFQGNTAKKTVIISFFDQFGRLVNQTIKPNELEILKLNITNLPNGVYYLKMAFEQHFFTQKILILKG